MKKKIFKFGILFALTLALALGLVMAVPALAVLPINWQANAEAAFLTGGSRLMQTQNNDGGWEWDNPDTNPTTGVPSPYNTLGVTGQGILDIYKVNHDPAYLAACINVYNEIVANSLDSNPAKHKIRGPDIGFCVSLSQITGDSTYADFAQTRWEAAKTEFGSDTATGFAEYVRDIRASQELPAIISWDINLYIQSLLALNTYYPEYASEAGDMAEVIYQTLYGTTPLFDFNTTDQDEYWLAYTGAIDAFLSTSTHGTETAALVTELMASQQPGGHFMGVGEGSDVQTTAYAMLALLKAGQTTSIENAAQYLTTAQLENGGWQYNVGTENTEITSEAMQAIFNLMQNIGPVSLDRGSDETIDVKTFTIQTAINGTSTGDTINVAAGTYPGALNLGGKSLEITGAGIDVTYIDASSTSSYAVQGFGSGSSINHLTLIGSSHYGFKVSNVNNINFDSVKVINSGKTAFDLNTVNGATLNNIEARDTGAGFGLMILDSTNINVSNVTTDNNAWGGVTVQTKDRTTDTVTFIGNFNVQEPLPLLLEKDPDPNDLVTYYDINNVTFPSQLEYAVYDYRVTAGKPEENYKQTYYFTTLENAKAYAQSIKSPIPPYTWSQIAVFNTAETNYYVSEGLKIQDAINHTTDGDIIHVETGTYNLTSPIKVTKPLTLTGDTTTPSNVVINAPTGVDDNDCFQIKADYVTIEGFTMTGAFDADSGAQNAAVMIGTHWAEAPVSIIGLHDITITHNDIYNCTRGIYVYRATDVTISYNKIHDIVVYGAQAVYTWPGKAIEIRGDGSPLDPQCHNIDIIGNEIYNCALLGIEINLHEMTPDDVIVDVDVLIDGNTIYNNGGNWAIHNGGVDVYVYRGISCNGQTSGVTITNNEIYGHDSDIHTPQASSAAIRLDEEMGYTITGNNLHDNHKGIRTSTSGSGYIVTGNTFTNNDIQVDDSISAFDIESVLLNNTYDRAVTVDHGGSLLHAIWSKIQDGIDNALDGDTINVAAGTYAEGLIDISKSLSIEGDPLSKPLIKPTADTITGHTGWFEVTGTSTVANFKDLQFDGEGKKINQCIRYEEGPTGTVENCDFSNISEGKYIGIAVCYVDYTAYNGGSALDIIDGYVKGCTFTNIRRIGISVFGVDKVYLQNNTYTGKGVGDWLDYGIEVGGGGVAIIEQNNIITGNLGVASTDGSTSAAILVTTYFGAGTQATITGNTLTGNTDGIAVGYNETDASVVTAHNNNLSGNTNGVYSTAPVVDATNNWWGSANGPTHTGNKYNVGSQGSIVIGTVNYAPWLKTEGGISFAPVTNVANGFASIQAAINAATIGDTINVKPGVFTEAIVISKPLTLLGATWNVNKNGYTVLAGYAWNINTESIIVHPNPTVAYNAVVDIVDIDNVTFEGFIVQELNAVDNLNTSLIRVYAHTRQISNINVSNNIIGPNTNVTVNDGTDGRMGLYIVNHPYSNLYGVVNSTFAGNKIFDCKGNGNNVFIWSSYQNYGATGSASMAGTVISDNEIYGAHRSGIETSGGYTGLTIQNNKIYYNSGDTIAGKPDLMFGNGIVLVRGSGDSHNETIPGYGPENLTLKDNEIYNNQRNGIYIGPISQDFTITGNKIYNNGMDGIRLDLAESYNNPDFEEGDRIPWADQTENIAAHSNRIYNNTGYGVQVIGVPTNGFAFNAVNNWWGTGDAATIATKVIGNVDYDPWHLKAPVPLAVGEVTANSIVLNWTIGGVWNGDYYDFRYSTTQINTDADWNNARRITGEPTPVEGAQTMKIRGLNNNTTYYFALAITDSNYKSDISTTNAAKTLTTALADNTAPDAVTDLLASAGSPATTSIILTWTATGDDGAVGFAARYIIKQSTSPITDANFNAAATVFNNLVPKASGQAESFTISKLNPHTRYYFAIKAQDEVPNTSSISVFPDIETANFLPRVDNITPVTGDNGEARILTFTGEYFTGGGTTLVRLVNAANIVSLTDVNIISDTQLTAVISRGAPTGTYQARVINNNGTSVLSTATYTVTAIPLPLPVVTNVIPNMAISDTIVNGVEVFGQHFTGVMAVSINNQAVISFTLNSDTKLTINVPGLPAGEYDVRVTTPGGTNDVSSVKFIVTYPVVISANTTEDTTTYEVIDLDNTNIIPVQITMTTDDSETATQNTDNDVEINVVIPPNTAVTDNHGNAYEGTLNPPRVVKPDTTIQTDLPENAIVIEMGNPDQTINFSQDFVAVVTVTATSVPDIYYFNKDTGNYELAGKAGVKDGITYEPGGTVLGEEDGTYTIGLLLDHMSVYVASTVSLLPVPTPTPTPTPGGGGGGAAPAPPLGTTNIQGMVTTTGRFLTSITAFSDDRLCRLDITAGTIGLDNDLESLTEITIIPAEELPPLPEGWYIIGLPYDLGPGGSSFDPAVTLTFKYSPTALSANTNVDNLVLAYYDEALGEWVKLDSIIDTANKKVTAEITHFTVFALVSVREPAALTVSSLSISPVNAVAGEKVTISIIVTNAGGSDGDYTAALQINSVNEAEKSYTIAAGTSQTISFDVIKEKAGNYNVVLNGLSGSFTVTAPPSPTPTPTPAPTPEATPTPTPEVTPTPSPAPSTTTTTTPAATQAAAPEAATNWSMIAGLIAAGAVIFVMLTILYFKRRRD